MDRRHEKHEWVPGALGIGITVLVALATITPYFYNIPKDNMNLITQAQTTLWNGWMVVLAYYYGSSRNQAKAQDTMNVQAQTAATAGAALAAAASPVATADIPVAPGETVSVTGVDADAASATTAPSQPQELQP